MFFATKVTVDFYNASNVTIQDKIFLFANCKKTFCDKHGHLGFEYLYKVQYTSSYKTSLRKTFIIIKLHIPTLCNHNLLVIFTSASLSAIHMYTTALPIVILVSLRTNVKKFASICNKFLKSNVYGHNYRSNYIAD